MFHVELMASPFLNLISKQERLNAAVSMFLFPKALTRAVVEQSDKHQFTAIKFGTHL